MEVHSDTLLFVVHPKIWVGCILMWLVGVGLEEVGGNVVGVVVVVWEEVVCWV